MGLNFRKSITLCKGVKLNLGSKSASLSVGTKGIHQSISTTGRTTTSLGIPGTGVSYTKSTNLKKIFGGLFGKKEEKEEKKDSGKKDSRKEKEPKAAAASIEAKEEAAAAKQEEDRKTYEAYTAQIETMKHIHCVADEAIDWQEVFDRPEPAGSAMAGLRSDTKEACEEWKNLHELAEKVLKGDIDSYLSVVEEMKPFDDLLEYGSDFEVGTEDPGKLEVEFRVRSAEVIPEREYVLNAKGELKEKELSKSAYYALLQDYVCSAVLRVARDSFALLPVEDVIIHAVDMQLNTATGLEEERTILSTKIGRQQLAGLNFERLDPSDAVSAFQTKMAFQKTKGFQPVARIEE